jgi:hypothetical protein
VITGRRYGYGDPAVNSPITLTLAGEIRDTAFADFDEDADVDQADFGFLQGCFSGSASVRPGCEAADLTGDGEADNADLIEFLACMSGTNVHSPCAPP